MAIFGNDTDEEEVTPYTLPVVGAANLYQAQADESAGFLTDTANFITALPVTMAADVYNSTGAIQKFFGGDGWETDTHELIDSYDSDAADYYRAHKGLVDGASLVATSLVPGTMGIKALRAVQAGASNSRALSMLGFNTINPMKLEAARKAATDRAALSTSTWDAVTGELGKALALGVASNTLDMAAFGLGAMAATNSSPLYEGMDAFDLTKMVVKDAVIFGGVVGGVLSAGKTFYTMRGAAHAEDMKTIAGRNIDAGSDFERPSVRIATAITSLSGAVAKNGGVAIPETVSAVRGVVSDFAQGMIPESDTTLRVGFGNFATRFVDTPVAAANFFGKLTKVERVVQPAAGAELPKLVGHALPVDISTGTIYAHLKDVPYHIGDTVPFNAKFMRGGMDEVKIQMGQGAKDRIIKATNDITNAEQMQASYYYAATLKSLPKEVEISARSLPIAERMLEEAQRAAAKQVPLGVTFYDAAGNAIDDLDDAVAALRAAKIEAVQKLQAAEFRDTPEDIAAKLNISTKFLDDPHKADVQLRSVSGLVSGKESIATFLESPRIVAAHYDIGTRTLASGKEQALSFKKPTTAKPTDVFKLAMQGEIYPERLVTSPAVAGANIAIYEAEAAAYISNVLAEGRAARELASIEVLPQLSNAGVLVKEDELLGVIQQASRTTNAQTLLKSADNDYGSFGAFMQKIGAFSKRAGDEAKHNAQAMIGSAIHKLANDFELGRDWQLLQTKLRTSPGSYVLDPAGTSKLIRQDIAINQRRFELSQASDKKYIPVDAMEGDAEIAVSETLLNEVLIPHTELNNIRLTNRVAMDNKHMPGSSANKALEAGLSPVYHVPVDTTKLSHFVFVRDKSRLVGNGGGVGMMLAKDAEGLMAKRAALESEFPGRFEFITKEQTKSFHKARGEYDYERGMNENFVDSALRRTGKLADLTPTLSAEGNAQAARELLAFHQRSAVREVRDAVEMRFSDAFGQLEFLGKQFDFAGSRFGTQAQAVAEAKSVRNPYRDAVNMALDKGSADEFPLWRQSNAFVERFGDTTFQAVRSSWESLVKMPLTGTALDAEVASLNKAAEGVGLEPLFTKMAVAQFKDQLPMRPVLRSAIAKTQAFINGTMLGADFIQAINNTLGQVMFAAEFSSLIKQIEKAEGGAGLLAGINKVKIPGMPYSIDSAIKMQANATRRFFAGGQVWDEAAKGWKQVTRDEMRGEYTEHGLLTSISKQYHQAIDDLTMSAKDLSDAELNKRVESALEFARKWTGNNLAEEYTRFVSADAARQLTDAAMAAGVIKSKAVASVYWNTAVNRVHGVNIASQRAVIFQGVIGQSIGMFMTYQHNLMQQLFRYASAGDTPAMTALAASQFGLYGVQGLPAFNAVATHLVGNAPGNAQHTDPYTYIAKHGGESAEWILYGAGSNALGLVHPDLKFNLYSRGDINPRQLTVFPTSVENTVVYTATLGAIKNVFDTVGNIANEAPVLESLLQGLAHNNLNRPLSGLGSVLQGMQTDNAGKWIGDVAGAGTGNPWDKLQLANFVRIAGAKPLDDAAAADAMFRATAYKAKTTSDIRELAESMRLTQQDGQMLDAEKMQEFAQAYAKRGGNIKNFRAFVAQTYKSANSNQVAEYAMKQRDPQSQHVAAVLGATQERAWLGEEEN